MSKRGFGFSGFALNQKKPKVDEKKFKFSGSDDELDDDEDQPQNAPAAAVSNTKQVAHSYA